MIWDIYINHEYSNFIRRNTIIYRNNYSNRAIPTDILTAIEDDDDDIIVMDAPEMERESEGDTREDGESEGDEEEKEGDLSDEEEDIHSEEVLYHKRDREREGEGKRV